LKEEIGIELELMDKVVNELLSLKEDLSGREPTIREKTATAAFLAQWYHGVENIIKRIYRTGSRVGDENIEISGFYNGLKN
jgi:hypothetical protein